MVILAKQDQDICVVILYFLQISVKSKCIYLAMKEIVTMEILKKEFRPKHTYLISTCKIPESVLILANGLVSQTNKIGCIMKAI